MSDVLDLLGALSPALKLGWAAWVACGAALWVTYRAAHRSPRVVVSTMTAPRRPLGMPAKSAKGAAAAASPAAPIMALDQEAVVQGPVPPGVATLVVMPDVAEEAPSEEAQPATTATVAVPAGGRKASRRRRRPPVTMTHPVGAEARP